MLFIVGTIMLFIATSWKWGLAGLGISWLVLMAVNYGITAAYRAHEYIDPLLIKRVNEVISIEEQHHTELEDFLNSTSMDEFASLAISFLDDLRHNWAREYSQLNPERLPHSLSVSNRKNIERAYKAGYMIGKGWISIEHLTDYMLFLGDNMAREMMMLQTAKSRGNAFASGYIVVAARGQSKGIEKG
jgi:hypothetical protein